MKLRLPARFLTLWWLGISLTTLFSIPYLARFTDALNRWFYHWAHADFLTIVSALVLQGLLIALSVMVLRRWVSPEAFNRIVVSSFFLLVLVRLPNFSLFSLFPNIFYHLRRVLHFAGEGVLASFVNIGWHLGEWSPEILIYLAAFFLSYRVGGLLIKWLRTGLIIGSFIFPLVLLRLAGFQTYPVSSGTLPDRPQRGGSNVYVFLFDELGYEGIFENRKIKEEFGSLRDFSETAIVFHNAVSQEKSTAASIPWILSTPAYGPEERERRIYAATSTADYFQNNVFEEAGRAGFHRYIAGYGLPYPFYFEKDVDYAMCAAHDKSAHGGFLYALFEFTVRAWGPSLSWMPWLGSRLTDTYVINRSHIFLSHKIHRKTLEVLGKMEGPGFGYFHYPLPHGPYVFNKSGVGLLTKNRYNRDVSYFHGNVYQVDRFFSEITQTLKDNQQWDGSLIIVTADHGGGMSPALFDAADDVRQDFLKKHVTLLLKLPGQKQREDTDVAFNLKDLKYLLIKAFQEGGQIRICVKLRR